MHPRIGRTQEQTRSAPSAGSENRSARLWDAKIAFSESRGLVVLGRGPRNRHYSIAATHLVMSQSLLPLGDLMSSIARSHPTITPGLLYHDAQQAIEWLCRVFGFQRHLVIPGEHGAVIHAHLTLGNGGIMLSSAEGYAHPTMCKSPRQLGGIGSAEIIVYVYDIDTHYKRSVAEGAEILIPIETKPYGGRGYACKDPEGYVWAFGNYDAWAG
jgi:uncharacterized glyoxalase superfamily protein PhnB